MQRFFTLTLLVLSFITAPLAASQVRVMPTTPPRLNNETDVLTVPLPEEVIKSTQAWLQENPQVAATTLGYESFIPTYADIEGPYGIPTISTKKTIVGLVQPVHDMLKTQKTPNMSPSVNYVFQHPRQENWLIKISGHINRKINISHLIQALEMDGHPWGKPEYNYGRALSQADYDRFARELPVDAFDKIVQNDGTLIPVTTAPKTYQHITRIAHYLLLLDAMKKPEVSAYITAPQMGLVHIPGRPTELSDRNYIVVEEKLGGLQEIEQLTHEEDRAMRAVAYATGIFNITDENCKRTAGGKIAILDFEQPNNSLPTQFFHKSHERFVNNCNAGLNSYEDMKAKIEAQQKARAAAAAATAQAETKSAETQPEK